MENEGKNWIHLEKVGGKVGGVATCGLHYNVVWKGRIVGEYRWDNGKMYEQVGLGWESGKVVGKMEKFGNMWIRLGKLLKSGNN